MHHRIGHRASGNIAAQPLLERAYAYDLSGQLVAWGDTLRGRQNFRYDPTGRILAALPGAGSHQPRELFAFDPAGNLLDGGEAQVGGNTAAKPGPTGAWWVTTACASTRTCTSSTTCTAM
ncbi:hypothetical protein AVKW3434_22280 [Acidovorax sp. SUPP3434]|uniref:hypothetical protein n=1 Tax=Acidovorax sp. SUPP3434 TaxID=2920880 RepID=UPI0023DE59FB|nr:hypothetical protein [Acidovorax sp. SUPP3434]GKT02167.1 hypothetical protein AVKW3434_22280 [Acidovorax sp. SUPP3434]